ncbi:MAG: DEAD/DEAH box helicase family protein, partial [Candidatus Latescibacteria bacterium]|nr:DEAD/DEAH box helicase family protein [Candidatus Latescibacterota bacterium]
MMNEAQARIKINNLLQEVGWRFFDDANGKVNIRLEDQVKLTKNQIDEFGNDFEKTKNGFIDFLLLDKNGDPLVVLEAKAEHKDPLDGKEQARRYAHSKNVRYVILSNGNTHYLWDIQHGNPAIIRKFPSQDSFESRRTYNPNPQKLAKEKIGDDYIALTQNHKYASDPRWKDESPRLDYIIESRLRFLRPYQLEAIQALQESAGQGNDRFLFEMATGTGKTLVSAAIIKLFLRTGNATRILFLVDRLELENQAQKNFRDYLQNDYKSVIYKENHSDWQSAEIVVTTIQSLSFNDKYHKLFVPTDFDLVISDEAHRSISGNSRAVFEYFIGYKLGLTATPKDYLKNVSREDDIRAWERRQLLDTYRTFGCESGDPTFRYSLVEGVRGGYLINPLVADARTDITTEMLSEQGYSVIIKDESGDDITETVFKRDYERKFFSRKTNHIFCKTFIENALKDPVSGEIGKSIVFCVSQRHAARIAQILNEYAQRLWPDKYNSDFAVQVTSSIPMAQDFSKQFSNNNLNGLTRFLTGYKTSKTRVCVTVGMMTTGYDCTDILNLALMRPVFSPTDFVQIKGRGTRKHTFSYTGKVDGERIERKADKEYFKLFDFFATCEYFEEEFDYDEVLGLPKEGSDGEDRDKIPNMEQIVINVPDPLKTLVETPVGTDGMRVDRELFIERFRETCVNDPVITDAYDRGDYETAADHIR